jgi:hypothetical protein
VLPFFFLSAFFFFFAFPSIIYHYFLILFVLKVSSNSATTDPTNTLSGYAEILATMQQLKVQTVRLASNHSQLLARASLAQQHAAALNQVPLRNPLVSRVFAHQSTPLPNFSLKIML